MKEFKVELPDGTKLATRTKGNMRGEVVIFVNGSIFNYQQFDPQLFPAIYKHLGDDYSYVFYNYVGIDGSSELEGDYDFLHLADQHRQLLDALGLEKVHHFGYSKGSAISFLASDRAKSIGSLGSPNFTYKVEGQEDNFSERVESLKKIQDIWDERITRENYKRVYTEVFLPMVFRKPKGDLSFLERIKNWYVKKIGAPMLIGTPIRSLVSLYSMYARPFPEELKGKFMDKVRSVECPVLLMHAKNDETVPLEGAKDLRENLSNAELYVYGGMGHISPAFVKKYAEAVAKDYCKFVRSYMK